MYENAYHDSIEQDPRKPQYRFWRPALTKWFLRMHYLHAQGTQVLLLSRRHISTASPASATPT